MKSFMKFRKQKDILLCELERTGGGADQSSILSLLLVLTLNTISFYMRRLRAIYNSAVKGTGTLDRKPFAAAFTRTTKTSKRAIYKGYGKVTTELKIYFLARSQTFL